MVDNINNLHIDVAKYSNMSTNQAKISTMVDYSKLQMIGENLLYLKNHGSYDNFDYEFFEVNSEELVSVYKHKQEYESFIEIEEKNALLEKEYFEKCKAIIPPSKIFKVLHAEIKFNRNMLYNNFNPRQISNIT